MIGSLRLTKDATLAVAHIVSWRTEGSLLYVVTTGPSSTIVVHTESDDAAARAAALIADAVETLAVRWGHA